MRIAVVSTSRALVDVVAAHATIVTRVTANARTFISALGVRARRVGVASMHPRCALVLGEDGRESLGERVLVMDC